MLIFILSPQELRAPSADRRETLPRDQYVAEFYNASPKIRGPPIKNFEVKNIKIWADFTQLPTLITNISGTRKQIQNRKDMWSRTIPPAFNEASPVNFGLLHKVVQYMCLEFGPTHIDFFDRLYIFDP